MNRKSACRRFQIGAVSVAVRSCLRSLLNDYASLYADYESSAAGPCDVEIEVRREPRRLGSRCRFEIRANGEVRFTPTRRDGVLPHIDWAVNLEVPLAKPEYLQLHASTLERNGIGIILAGPSGCGKSTLTAGLLARGWRYLCDEFALLGTESLELHPYPRAICIKEPSYPVIESLGLRFHERKYFSKGFKGFVGFLNPLSIRPGILGRPCLARWVIFPQYSAGADPVLIPISRAEAAFSLHPVCFNLLACRRLGLDVLASLVRGAECFRLVSGEIRQTCALIERLIDGDTARSARIA